MPSPLIVGARTSRRTYARSPEDVRCSVVVQLISATQPFRERSSHGSCRRRFAYTCRRHRVRGETVAYTLLPTRKACTGQSAEDARQTTWEGSEVAASLWPPNASKTSSRPAKSGSSQPEDV